MTIRPTLRRSMLRRSIGALAAGAVALTACGDDTASPVSSTTITSATTSPTTSITSPTTTSPATSTTTATSPTTTTTTSPPVEAAEAGVYWAWSIPTHAGSPERLAAGEREVAAGDPAVAALEALVAGPNEIESDMGMSTAIPEGTQVRGVSVTDGLAVADFDAAFAASSGSLAETTRLAQVVFTLTDIDGIDRVAFAIEGERRDPVLSHGFVVGDGVDRSDFESVRPLILVEEPGPGQLVTSDELVVAGESNTFEATVQWELVDGDGTAVADGFTTATAGMGTWGEFSYTVDVSGVSTERAAIVVFETSARDGARVNVVEIPFRVAGS